MCRGGRAEPKSKAPSSFRWQRRRRVFRRSVGVAGVMSARWLRPSIFQHFEIILLPYKPPHGRVHLVHIDRNGGFNIPRVVQFIGNGIAISFHILFPVSTPKAHSETSVLKINSHLPAPTTNYPYSTI